MKENPIEELMKWNYTEGFQSYMTEIVRLALEARKDSDKVVLSHTTFLKPMRTFLRKLLTDAGAKDVMVIFLDVNYDAHNEAVRLAMQAGSTIEELMKGFGVEGVLWTLIHFVNSKVRRMTIF